MDKWIELLTRYLPGSVILGAIAVIGSFFLTYYYKRHRIYGDVFYDRFFLNLTVLVIVVVALYSINSGAQKRSMSHPLLIMPLFQNDEGNLYRTALTSQLENELQINEPTIQYYESLISDIDDAKQIAKKYGASAVIYKASVINNENALASCFSILIASTDESKSCPMVPLKIPKDSLTDIAKFIKRVVLTPLEADRPDVSPNPTYLLSKIEALQQELDVIRDQHVNEVRIPTSSASDHPNTGSSEVALSFRHQNKQALVVGIDHYASREMSGLRYATADAKRLSSTLNSYNFQVRSLFDSAATRAGILQELSRLGANANDLVVIYFSGMSIKLFNDNRKEELYLLPFDYDVQRTSSGISITELKKQVEALGAPHKLVIVDGCNGTTGLEAMNGNESQVSGDSKQPAFLFMAGTQDNQIGLESMALGGGAFTQSLLRAWNTIGTDTEVTIEDLFLKTQEYMRQAQVNQQPKLVRVSGRGEIVLSRR